MDNFLYQIALRYKRKNIIKTKHYSFENIDYLVKNYSYLEIFKNKTMFKFLVEDGGLDYLIKKFKEKDFNKYFYLNIDINEIKKIALKYSTINNFSKDYPKVIKYIRKNGLVDIVFEQIYTLKIKNKRTKKDKYIIMIF